MIDIHSISVSSWEDSKNELLYQDVLLKAIRYKGG